MEPVYIQINPEWILSLCEHIGVSKRGLVKLTTFFNDNPKVFDIEEM